MNDNNSPQHDDADELIYRCPHCDSVVQDGDIRCLMCGQELDESVFAQSTEPTKAPPPLAYIRQISQQDVEPEPVPAEPPAVLSDEPPAVDTTDQPAVTESPPPKLVRTGMVIDDFDPNGSLEMDGTEADQGQKALDDTPKLIPTGLVIDDLGTDSVAEPKLVSTGIVIDDVGSDLLSKRPIEQPKAAVTHTGAKEVVTQTATAGSHQTAFRLFPDDKPDAPLAAMVALFAIFTLCAGSFAFFRPQVVAPILAQVETWTPTATATLVPSSTPIIFPTDTPTPTPEISNTPTATFTPAPTDTPQPPRPYTVEAGQNALSISLIHGVTLGSFLEENDFSDNPILFEGQEVFIPWPTATPPLAAVTAQVGEEILVVDPSSCPPFYEITDGDNLFQIAADNRIPLEAMLAINYLNQDSIVQPGDVICIPEVTSGPLPPTPGPSPTPSLTPSPRGPEILYPHDGAVIISPDQPFALQWLAVKDLAENEWYMVEFIDLTNTDAYPRRGFTRANAFRVPTDWRPESINDQPTDHQIQWRVSIVQVTGERADGRFTYTYGGETSRSKTFLWLSR